MPQTDATVPGRQRPPAPLVDRTAADPARVRRYSAGRLLVRGDVATAVDHGLAILRVEQSCVSTPSTR